MMMKPLTLRSGLRERSPGVLDMLNCAAGVMDRNGSASRLTPPAMTSAAPPLMYCRASATLHSSEATTTDTAVRTPQRARFIPSEDLHHHPTSSRKHRTSLRGRYQHRTTFSAGFDIPGLHQTQLLLLLMLQRNHDPKTTRELSETVPRVSKKGGRYSILTTTALLSALAHTSATEGRSPTHKLDNHTPHRKSGTRPP